MKEGEKRRQRRRVEIISSELASRGQQKKHTRRVGREKWQRKAEKVDGAHLPQVCVIYASMFLLEVMVRSTAYSHGHSCLGIKRNMRRRQLGAGTVERPEKALCLPLLGLS